MKGTIFQKPLEFNVVIEGETWHQGDPIKGTLTVRNHGPAEAPLDGIKVALAHGALSKVRQKSPKAFEILTAVPFEHPAKLSPQQEAKLAWEFKTDRNCPITENSRSPFLLYGQGEATEKVGQLQLQIIPFSLIQEFLDIMSISFRFVFKSRKSSKGWVTANLEPPSARAFATVEELALQFHFEGDELQVRYGFGMKGIDAAAGMKVNKVRKDFEQVLVPDQYRLSSGRFNHEGVETAIREVLEKVGSTALV